MAQDVDGVDFDLDAIALGDGAGHGVSTGTVSLADPGDGACGAGHITSARRVFVTVR